MKPIFAALAVSTALIAPAMAQDNYGQAFQAFQKAMGEGRSDDAKRHAKMAWEMAEKDASANDETRAILAQTFVYLEMFDDPSSALPAAERSLALGQQGYGTTNFTMPELAIMATTTAALVDPDTPKRRAAIEALDAYWAQGGTADTLPVTAAMQLANISLTKTAYVDVIDLTTPLGEALSRLDDVPIHDFATANVLRAAATLSRGDVFKPKIRRSSVGQTLEGVGTPGQSRRLQALSDAAALLDITENFFPTQTNVENYDRLLAQVQAWSALTEAYSESNELTPQAVSPFVWNGTTRLSHPTYSTPCPVSPYSYKWKKKRDVTYPNSASAQELGGAVMVGFHFDDSGSVVDARVLAEVPSDRFSRNVLRAMDDWVVDLSTVPDGCRRDNLITHMFYVHLN
ncbi:TonB family protein [Parvularcula sp. LCG005]|uniref:TonB family protein n=1 Tax=Parvularcula sp. LCG005 TaxID=3078805 RepID=UPI0029431B45|nr:TonB family protein [Parvularcula sp. LCG005]WOI53148.1 TonB family protein [Parvularcula sp. LCG005]